MKKVVLGSMMFLAGLLSAAVLLAGTMDNDWNVNGELSSFRNMAQYGFMPVFHYKYAIAKCLSIYEEKRECKNY